MPSGRVLVVHNKTEVAPTVRRLAASLLKREELVTKVDEGHVLAFTTKLEFEDLFVERQSFLNVAHFKGNVVETHSARSSGFGHEILMGRAVRASHTPALSEPQASPNDQYIPTILHKVNLGWGRPSRPSAPKALPRIQTKSRSLR